MSDSEYNLAKSKKALGPLYPILKAKDGSIIDGFHRQNDDPDWAILTLDSIDTPVKIELARLAANFCRRQMPATEFQNRVAFLVKSGLKVSEIAEQTGINESTIYRHMPQELKDQERSEATKKGIEEHRPLTCEVSSKTSDTISDLVECDNCHMATHIIKMKALDDKDLCPLCFDRLSKLPKLAREQVSEKRSEPVKESWEYRKSVMTPGISKMDEEVYLALQNNKVLRDAGWKFEFQKHYCLKEVISDTTATRNDVEKPLFFDGDVHIGKEDRDEANRALLARRLKSAEVLTFAYSGDYSDAKRDMMASKIEKSLLEILSVVKTEVSE